MAQAGKKQEAAGMAKSIKNRADLAIIAPEFNPDPGLHGKPLQGCCIIGLDTDDGSEHRYYDRRILQPVTEEQIQSMIASGGDIEPISIVKGPTESNFIVRTGRRRVMAARAANERLVAQGLLPIRLRGVLHAGNDDRARIVKAQENLCRLDLSPLDEAQYVVDIMDLGYSIEEVARFAQRNVKWVETRLALVQATPELKQEVRAGTIGTSAAEALASLPEPKQREVVKELVETAAKNGHKQVPTREARSAAGRQGTHRPGLKVMRAMESNEGLPAVVRDFLHWYRTGKGAEKIPGLSAALGGGDS